MNCTVGLVTVSGGGHGFVVCCNAGCGGLSNCDVSLKKKSHSQHNSVDIKKKLKSNSSVW